MQRNKLLIKLFNLSVTLIMVTTMFLAVYQPAYASFSSHDGECTLQELWDPEARCVYFATFDYCFCNLYDFINRVIVISYVLGGGAILVVTIIGGYQYLTSRGLPDQIMAGKETLKAALIGGMILFGSYFILQAAEALLPWDINFI